MARCGIRGVVCLIVFFTVASPRIVLAAASLSGRVTDAVGGALPGVHVTATHIDTNVAYAAVTNQDGVYLISSLPSGVYRVAVELSGFKTIVKPDVDIHVQDNVALNFAMEVGSVIESVTVEGGAPLVSMNPAVGTLVNRSFVQEMPLNGRSFQSLITLTPGVVLTKATGTEQGQFSANGQRADANYFTVDGVSANIGVTAGSLLGQGGGGSLPGLTASGGTNNLVSIDALEEFRIETSTYAPEYGRTAGAQVSLVTRAGTNQIHGAAFDYFRHDAFDANDWFANSRGLPKPQLRQHDFGGVLGGPLVQNRLFFFGSYEGLKLRRPQVSIVNVPTLAARAATVAPARPLIDAFPRPTGSEVGDGLAEFSASYSNPASLSATSVRVDYARSAGARFFGRVNIAPSNDDTRVASLNSVRHFEANTKTYTGGASLLAGSRTTFDVHANLSTNDTLSETTLDTFGGAVVPAPRLLLPASAPDGSGYQIALLDSGISVLVGRLAANTQRQVNVTGSVTHLAGNHLLKAGVDYRRMSPTFAPQPYGSTPIFLSLASLQAGITDLLFIITQDENRTPIFNNYAAYAQDAWTATPKLTLTYGVRWDYSPAPYESHGRDPILADTSDLSNVRLRTDNRPLYVATKANLAPRVGAAYRLVRTPGRETVLRGGYGLFYDLATGRVADVFSEIYPYDIRRILFGVPLPYSAADLAPGEPGTAVPLDSGVYSFPGHLTTARTRQWNVSVERAVGSSNSISISYVAAAGSHLLRGTSLVSPELGDVLISSTDGRSDYQSVQVQFKHRLSHGIEALAAYTWSRSRDNGSDDTNLARTPSAFNGADADYGPSDFDIPHVGTGAVTWNLPGAADSGLLGTLSRHWSLDGLFTARAAAPASPRGRTSTGVFSFTTRPDVVAGVPWYLDDSTLPGGRRFNPAAFAVPPAGRQGTLPRNALRGFSAVQIDSALRRSFELTTRVRLQAKLEAFNIFNHPNFANPTDVLITSPTFGISSSMLNQGLSGGGTNGGFSPLYQVGGPRSLQLSLRVSF
jgi:hypothetical protein